MKPYHNGGRVSHRPLGRSPRWGRSGREQVRTKWDLLVRLIMLAGVFAIPLLAQGDRGEITGTVTDATGAVVPGGQVTVVHGATNAPYRTTTSTAGNFTVPSLPVGDYQDRKSV